MSGRMSRTIYVGNLPPDIREWEIEDLFYKYGRIVDIELKIPPRPPAYCFLEFEDVRDAEDAIRGRDGYNFDGCRLRVELAHGDRGHSSSFDRHSGYGGGHGSGSGKYGVSRRSEYRALGTKTLKCFHMDAYGKLVYLWVKVYEGSPSKSRNRSRSRSPRRNRSKSHSVSRSPSKSRSPRSRSWSESLSENGSGGRGSG